MLKKIIAIKNVGRFRNSALGGDTSLAKHSFIFGANGHGKTTICAILRSAKTGDATHVIGRKTLGVTDAAAVELLTSTGTIRFNGVVWDNTRPEIAIFDSIFVAENVHSGDVVDSEQKKNLYRVIVGEAGVLLAEKEAELSQNSRTKTTEITKAVQVIQPHTGGIKLEDFIALKNIDDIDQKITTQDVTLTTIREAAAIKARTDFTKLVIPALPVGFNDLLVKTIDDIAKDAELQIQKHFTAHNMATTGAAWVVLSIDHADNSCPFCGQDIQQLPLIAAYKSVFSEKYKSLRQTISNMKGAIDQAFDEAALARLDTFNAQHKASVEFWSKYCAIDQIGLNYPLTFATALVSLRASAIALIDKKASDPLEAIATDQSFLNAVTTYESEKAKVDALNQAINVANGLITAKKAEVGAADVAAATAELQRLKAIKTRHSPAVVTLCNDYTALVGAKADIETTKAAIRSQLDQHTNTVVTPYQRRINEFLDAFNAGFSITETKHSYTGGSATSTYQLVINKTPIDIGGSNTPKDKASFKNTLSAGDRSTLALAFFLAHLERDVNLVNKIIVFDDPFNSQDAFRRRQTIHEIIKIGKQCAQVLVLSHDATFLKQIWDKCQPAERAALTLADHGQFGTKITQHDLEKACQGRTATDLDDLQAYHTNGVGQHIDIIRKMRAVLETYMRTTYLVNFDDADWLGDIVRKIREGEQAHPAWPLYNELNEINDYTAQYHHGENVADTTPDAIDSTELRGFSKRTLRIVNAMQA